MMISPKSWLLPVQILWSRGTQSAVFPHLKEWRMGPQAEEAHKEAEEVNHTDPKCLRESKMFILRLLNTKVTLKKGLMMFLLKMMILCLLSEEWRGKQISTPEKQWATLATDADEWVLGECGSRPWGAQKGDFGLGM